MKLRAILLLMAAMVMALLVVVGSGAAMAADHNLKEKAPHQAGPPSLSPPRKGRG